MFVMALFYGFVGVLQGLRGFVSCVGFYTGFPRVWGFGVLEVSSVVFPVLGGVSRVRGVRVRNCPGYTGIVQDSKRVCKDSIAELCYPDPKLSDSAVAAFNLAGFKPYTNSTCNMS